MFTRSLESTLAHGAMIACALLSVPAGTFQAQTPSATGGVAKVAGSVPTRRVWADTGLYLELGSPSPDGRFMSNMDLRYGNIWVRELSTGRMRALTNQGEGKPSTGFGWESVFSPDGKQVAFGWSDNASRSTQVRIVGVDSTAPRVLYPGDSTQRYVAVMDWSADGSYIAAAVQQQDKSWQLVLIPTAGGTPRLIRTFADWRGPTNVRVSPDGKHVAYSFAPRKDDGRRDVYVLTLQDNREQVIARHATDDVVLGFTANGTQLIFSSDRAGSPGVWSIALDGGRAAGDAKLVRGDLWRMLPLRLTSSGHVFYIVQAGDADVFVVPFDATTGRLRAAPVSVTHKPGEQVASPAWSNDGKFLAWLTFSGDYSRVGSTKLTIRSLESGETRTLTPPVGYLRRITWMPDGRSLLLNAANDKGIITAMRLDLATSAVAQLVDETFSGAVSPDGRTLYFVGSLPTAGGPAQSARRLVAADLATHRERDLFVAPSGTRVVVAYGRFEPNVQVTPDGKSVAFVVAPANAPPGGAGSTIMLAPVNGGAAKEIASSPPEWNFTNVRLVGFSPGGEQLIFTTMRGLGQENLEPATVWRVPLSGGSFAQLERPGSGRQSMAVSFDGKRVAFTSGSTAEELWVMEDPALQQRAATRVPQRR